MNVTILNGHIGKDPEIKPNGIAEFSLATSEKWKDKEGNKKEKTQWHNVVCFGAKADFVAKWVKKGMKILLTGKIDYQSWENPEGEKKYKTVIICQDIEFNNKKESKFPEPKILDNTPF